MGKGTKMREVPIGWEALEDAFENNAPEVHSYLHLQSGEVLRIVGRHCGPGDAWSNRAGSDLPSNRSGFLAGAISLDGAVSSTRSRNRSFDIV